MVHRNESATDVLGLSVGNRDPRADRQCSELIERIVGGAPVRQLVFVEALGHMRAPFTGYRLDPRAGVELATIDAQRAAEAAADFEGRFDDGVARQARRDRLEIRDFPGRATAGVRVPVISIVCGMKRTHLHRYADAARRFFAGRLYVIILRFLRDRAARSRPPTQPICVDWQVAALKITYRANPADRIGMVSLGRGGPTNG